MWVNAEVEHAWRALLLHPVLRGYTEFSIFVSVEDANASLPASVAKILPAQPSPRIPHSLCLSLGPEDLFSDLQGPSFCVLRS